MKRLLVCLCLAFFSGCTPTEDAGPKDGCQKYDRDSFGYGNKDYDGDGCYARAELLIARSLAPVEMHPDSRCRVARGKWLDAYSDDTLYSADSVEIDHVVALNEAHQSGAHAWDNARRAEFGNRDTLEALVITKSSTNGKKSDLDIGDWLPPGTERRKKYAEKWVRIKRHWGLSVDHDEMSAIKGILGPEAAELPGLSPEFECPD